MGVRCSAIRFKLCMCSVSVIFIIFLIKKDSSFSSSFFPFTCMRYFYFNFYFFAPNLLVILEYV